MKEPLGPPLDKDTPESRKSFERIRQAAREVKSPSQIDKFKEAARELGCDESEERFEEALRKIGRKKPPQPKDESKGG